MFIYPWGDMHSLNLGWFLLEFKAWIEKIQEYLDNGGGTSENLANVIAPVFNAANSYLTGDYVLYNDELYKALEPVPPGTWNPDAWERCLVTEEMGSAASGVDNVARLMIAGQYSNTYNYQKYAICRYADKLWMCNTNLPTGGEEWTPTHWDEITVGAGLTGLRRSVETISDDITNLNGAFKTAKNITALDGLSNESCFFTANAAITLSPTSTVIPQYSKGIFVTTGNDAIIVALTPTGKIITAYRNGANWVYDKNINDLITAEETARIAADERLATAFEVNGISDISTIMSYSLFHCNGTLVQAPNGKIIDNKLYLCGRMRITITERTGNNPGITWTLPNGLKVDGTVGVQLGTSDYTDSARYGEASQITATDDSSTITMGATESVSNVTAGKTLVFFFPPIVIKLK